MTKTDGKIGGASEVTAIVVTSLLVATASMILLAAGVAIVRHRRRLKNGQQCDPEKSEAQQSESDAGEKAKEFLSSLGEFPSVTRLGCKDINLQPKAATKSVLKSLGFVSSQKFDSFEDLTNITVNKQSSNNESDSSDMSSSEPLGKLKFTLGMNPATSQLSLNMVQGRLFLPKMGSFTSGDSGFAEIPTNGNSTEDSPRLPSTIFIRATLLPQESHVKQTKNVNVSTKGLLGLNSNNQIIQLKPDDLKMLHCYKLALHAVDSSDLKPYGEIIVPLKEIDLTGDVDPDSPSAIVQQYYFRKPTMKINGELLLTLCWKPAVFRLQMTVNRAKNLLGEVDDLDTYVKVVMFNEDEQFASNKTTVQVQSAHPVYEETFTFNLAAVRLEDCRAELSLIRLSSTSEIRGTMSIGAIGDQDMDGYLHFLEMVSKPGHAVPMWHSLNGPPNGIESQPQSILTQSMIDQQCHQAKNLINTAAQKMIQVPKKLSKA